MSILNKDPYISDFQVGINNLFNKIHSPSEASGCRNGNPGCYLNDPENCVEQEKQSGPNSHYCIPQRDCHSKNTLSYLSYNGYLNTSNNNLYYFRDSILRTTIKGKTIIDDYYFLDHIIQTTPVSLEFALKAKDVYQSSFYDKISKFNEQNYNDSILINKEDELKIISLLQYAKSLNSDLRFKSIIDKTIIKVEASKDKSISILKNEM